MDKPKHRAWELYNEDRQRTFSHEEIKNMILNCRGTPELKCLFALLYLTGSRAQEILRYKYVGAYRDDIPTVRFPSIRVGDLVVKHYPTNNEDGYIKMLEIRTRVLKCGHVSGQKLKLREENPEEFYDLKRKSLINIPTKVCVLIENNGDDDLIMLIEEYLDSEKRFFNELFQTYEKTEELFSKSHGYYRCMCQELVGVSLHQLRNIRSKMLIMERNYNISLLQKIHGWRSANMAAHYIESTGFDILNHELNRLNNPPVR